MSSLIIVTGYSRGIGRGLAKAYALSEGENLGLIGIARSDNPDLDSELNASCLWFRSLKADLGDHTRHLSLLRDLGKLTDAFDESYGKPEKVILVNNAAVTGPLMLLSALWQDDGMISDSSHTMTINCLAPAVLAGWFLKRFGELESREKYILNMSSGAARGDYPGLAFYSMSKAALNVLSISLTAEQSTSLWPVKTVSLSPGMVETDMQEIIRATDSEDFPEGDFFRNAATEGKLRSTEEVAEAISALDLESFESGGYYHVNDIK